MIRIDMSEYMEKHTVSRLIGAPPGYVGYEEGGQLSEAVRRRPYSVVLFDEIEKAHHDVFNVLLQVLDDGRLTDGQGRTVDFKNTIVIMTSNLGSPIIQEYFMDGHTDKSSHQTMEDKVMAELKRHFRPEFLNRVDDVIIFQSLDESEIERIVDIQLEKLKKRLAQQQLTLDVDKAAKNCWPRKVTTRNSARARSNAPCRNAFSIRCRCACSKASSSPVIKSRSRPKGMNWCLRRNKNRRGWRV